MTKSLTARRWNTDEEWKSPYIGTEEDHEGSWIEIENGNRTPSVIIFHALSEVLQCSMDWLATGESSETEKAAISASEDFKSNTEEELLKGFRQLDQDDQDELMGLLALKLRKVKRDGEKMETLSNSGDGEVSDKLA